MKTLMDFLNSVLRKTPSGETSYLEDKHPVMKWKTGDRFGEDMEIKGICEGGMARVFFLGPPHKSGVIWAAKSFKDEFMQNESAVVSFWHEAQSWIELGRHKNIVYAHRVFEVQGKPYLYLEFMPGGSLRRLMTKPMSVDKVLSAGIDVCTAMEYVYTTHGLIHRDLKPENVLIGAGGEIKVTDWGLSKVLDNVGSMHGLAPYNGSTTISVYNTHDGVAMGTPPYMPPEQFENAKNAGRSADIYALGIMLYEMLRGRPPFVGNSLKEYHSFHKHANPESLLRFRNDIPKRIDTCLLKALEKAPCSRFGSFAEFGDELLSISRNGSNNGKIKERVQSGVVNLSSEDLTHQGFGLLHLRRDEEAIAYFDKALQIYPQNYAALGYKSYCLGNLGRHDQAITAAKAALQINPLFAHAWANLGFSYSAKGEHDAAISAYERAISIEPDSVTHYNNICIAFKVAKKFEKAVEYAKKGLLLDPDYYRLWSNMAGSLIGAQRFQEAIDAGKQALRINRRDRSAWINLAEAYKLSGKMDEAARCVEEASKIDQRYIT